MPSAIQESSAKTMQVCIIGAGMAGLTCALALAKADFRHISVYEKASDLGFVGAGIQMAPNMARILDRLGVWEPIARKAVILNETSIRAGATDAELASLSLRYIEEQYGFPHMVGHRATLARELYNGCLRYESIEFFFGVDVQDVKLGGRPSFTAYSRKSGKSERADCELLLACDGVKSSVRDALLEATGTRDSTTVEETGQAAYRIMLTREQLQHDPELLALLDADQVVRWIGEKRHIIAYPVEDKSIYNLSTTQPDVNFAAAPSETYTTKGSKSAMLDVFSDYCPMVQRMLNLVPDGEVCEWKLRVHPPLRTWIHGSVALAGDACHPTLPHLAQGAAQAIEDAAVLGAVLEHMPNSDPETIEQALKVYEEVRKQRAETLVAMAAASGKAMHLGDGKEKEERDRQFAAIKANGGKGPVPDKWADADVQRMIYGFDCQQVAEEMAHRVFQSSKCEPIASQERMV